MLLDYNDDDYDDDYNDDATRTLCTYPVYEPSSHDLEVPAQNNIDGFRVSEMLLLQNSRGQSVFVVVVMHRDRFCTTIAPWSSSSSTKCTVQPETFTP